MKWKKEDKNNKDDEQEVMADEMYKALPVFQISEICDSITLA